MEQRTCPSCGATFNPSRLGHVYCSKNCKVNACHKRARAAQVPPTRLCEYCGRMYQSKRMLKRYCSTKCGNAAYRSSHSAQRSEYERKRYKQDKARRADYLTAYRDQRREHYRELGRTYAQSHQMERLLVEQERRAHKRGQGGCVQKSDWLRLLRRFEYRCFYCFGVLDQIHMDHVVPLSRGGRHTIGNVVPSCPACNMSKGAKFLADWRRS